MRARIAVLPGDGIGPEVTREAVACLAQIAALGGHDFQFPELAIGSAALDACGVPLPPPTLEGCLASDAVLLGAVGHPKHDDQPSRLKPEKGLLALRQGLGAFANIRPAFLHPALVQASPLKDEVVRGTDLVIVRELAGGLYFGEPRSLTADLGINTLPYSRFEVERIARVAFELARGRRRKVTSVDKANVLEASQLWRTVVKEVARDYPDVALDHMYVDSCAMAIVTRPTAFDVVLTDNLFGDILSDEASVLTGSLGMLPSASLGGAVGLYEPVHGSAPDLAGKGLANPLGAILSAAMLLRHSLGLEAEARAMEEAVSATLAAGNGTQDLTCVRNQVGTRGLGDLVRLNLAAALTRIPRMKTLYDKLWEHHVVEEGADGTALLYIDRHLVHEVTSPQAFEGLRLAGRAVRRPQAVLAVADHNIPTRDRAAGLPGIQDPTSRLQVETLEANMDAFRVPYIPLQDPRQGIVHIIGPEQGFTLPGTTVVCGDSHTSTHGAFGALAFGIGTSEVEHVLATQTLMQKRARNFRITVEGALPKGVGAKDLILRLIGAIGMAGGTGCALEFAGEAIRGMGMEARMTLCNMAIEAGARTGLVAPDETTFAYLKGRPFAPGGQAWEQAVSRWRALPSDPGAVFDREFTLDVSDLEPQVTWGTNPEEVLGITGAVPDPGDAASPAQVQRVARSLDYMGLRPGQPLEGLPVDVVFIGSCTNGRISDLRDAAAVLGGRKVAPGVRVLVVPGSGLVKAQAEAEGLDRLFREAGCEWREPGCSMCLAMNEDRLAPGQRCASTSNRNFEGRQGRLGRTHLLSPAMAAAAAVRGRLADVRDFL